MEIINNLKKSKRHLALLICFAAICCIAAFCAFKIDESNSIKNITKPYINRYECTKATLGDEDLLENYEYFRIDILDGENLELSFKRKDGNVRSYKSTYTYDNDSGELTAEIGILGCKFKQAVIIKNGTFTISMPILYKQLIMNFAVK
jgi:hypothetical protein